MTEYFWDIRAQYRRCRWWLFSQISGRSHTKTGHGELKNMQKHNTTQQKVGRGWNQVWWIQLVYIETCLVFVWCLEVQHQFSWSKTSDLWYHNYNIAISFHFIAKMFDTSMQYGSQNKFYWLKNFKPQNVIEIIDYYLFKYGYFIRSEI